MDNDIDYRDLPVSTNQIRLIKLHPRAATNPPEPSDGPSEEPLLCELGSFTRGSYPPFHALSYAWEPTGPNVSVLINGQSCQVSEIVEQALRWLWESQRETYVWIDQLCINQKDDIEKTIQVQKMRHIYTEADDVVAWLGMSFPHSDILFDYLHNMGISVREKSGKAFTDLHDDVHQLNELKVSFQHFCQRKYWTRLWIMQEFAVARSVRVVCANSSIDPDVLEEAMTAADFSRTL